MYGLHLAVYASPTGTLIADWSHRARNVVFSTGEHGYERLSAFIDLPALDDQMRFYDRPGLPHVIVSFFAVVVWEGRLEDVAITDGGLNITALGYWRALTDVPYTALWSTTSVAEWRPVTVQEVSYMEPARYQIDNNNRLYIALQHDATYAASGNDAGGLRFQQPFGGDRDVVAVSFNYDLTMPSTWVVQLFSANEPTAGSALTSATSQWVLTPTGSNQTGSVSVTFSGQDTVWFETSNAAASTYTYTGETGDFYVRITDIRIKTTTSSSVYANEIMKALVSFVNGINSAQLSSNTSLIQSPALDLKDEVYEDRFPADILTELAALGDNQTTPRRWEVGIYDNRALYLRPKGDVARQWYVDITSLELERTLETLTNSVYAIYKEASGRVLRTSANTDSSSTTRYGVTRRAAISSDTTSSTQANTHRDTALQDRKDPQPRAAITFNGVYDGLGARHPLWEVRAGDQITIRNLPPTTSTTIDRIRSFRIGHTEYRADDDELVVEPETPIAGLAFFVGRQARGIRSNTATSFLESMITTGNSP